jgi:hypothetical protein
MACPDGWNSKSQLDVTRVILTRRITDQAIDIRDFLRKGLAVAKQMKKTKHPATKRRGADPQVPAKSKKDIPSNSLERKLEQGLEESMAGSDPVSITQPSPTKAKKA